METFPWATEGDAAAEIQFVGGPRDGHVERAQAFPAVILAEAGEYRRSVRCADDRAMRYVWEAAPDHPESES